MRQALRIGLLCLGLCSSSAAQADSLRAGFERGNAAFAAKDYAGAVREYEALQELGVADPTVTFNLASAYGSLGQYGQAIRYFERTLLLDPSDEEARRSLNEARSALGERQASLRGEAIVAERPPLSRAIFAKIHPDTLAWLLLGAIWSAAATALVLLRTQREAVRLGLGIFMTAMTLLSLIAGFGLAAKNDFGASGSLAIILAEGAALRNGPAPAASLVEELPEGTHVRTLAHSAGYVRVRTSAGREGFVQTRDVGDI